MHQRVAGGDVDLCDLVDDPYTSLEDRVGWMVTWTDPLRVHDGDTLAAITVAQLVDLSIPTPCDAFWFDPYVDALVGRLIDRPPPGL